LAALFESQGVTGDEQLFQNARKWNIAQFQNIMAYELIPALVGERQFRRHFGDYEGYNRHQSPNIFNFFSTAAFRLHTLLNLPNLVIEANCSMILGELKNLTNFPPKVEERQTCEPIRFRQVGPVPVIRGSLIQRAQGFDNQVINSLRNLRLSAPGNGDVPAANIFRGRANGLPDFNTGKQQFGEPDLYSMPGCNPGVTQDPIACFRRITSNNTLASELRSIYKKVDKIDAWIGILAEKRATGSSIGRTSTAVFLEQMNNLRSGDRFWFERTDSGRLFSNHELNQIRRVKLSTLLNIHFPELDAQEDALFVNDDFCCN
jgi:hypothetical protein